LQSASTDTSVEAFVAIDIERDSVVEFALKNLQERQPGDDYREFLELSVIFLGGTPARGVCFQPPGAMHHARGMAKDGWEARYPDMPPRCSSFVTSLS